MARRASNDEGDWGVGSTLPDSTFRHLRDRSSIPTLTIDLERREIVAANAAALSLLALDASEVVGRAGADILVEPPPERLLRVRALRGEETASIREVATPRGTRTVELNVVPSGVEGFAFAEIIDRTDHLEAASRAAAREAELAATSAALRTIAMRLAHDLRGPMAAIAGFADLLVDEGVELEPQQRVDMLRRIGSNTRALAAMAASILSEADTGPARPEDSSSAVDDLFEAITSISEAQLAEVGGTLVTTTDVAALPVPVGAIRQAVVNLVSNSVKYRDPERPLRVEVAVRADAGRTEIVVRDNGRGLPHDPDELFEPGTRGPSAEGTSGAGLGLAFVRAAVESIGGSVTANAPAQGAELVIRLEPRGAPVTAAPEAGDAGEAHLSAPQLERLLEATPIATFVIDMSLRQIVRVNEAGTRLLGRDEADILGRAGGEFLDEASMADALRRRVMSDPAGLGNVSTRLRTPDGVVPARVWVALVEGTALAVAQVIEDGGAGDG